MMSRAKVKVGLAAAAVVVSAVAAMAGLATRPARADGRTGLAARLDAIFTVPALARAEVGAVFVDVADGSVLYERGADRPLTPASNQKVLTTACALERLGPGYELRTTLLRTGPIDGGVLRGDLVVRGGGDPSFGSRFDASPDEPFREWARALRERGVRRVAGSVVVDDRAFDREHVHADWLEEDLDRWYAAPVSAICLNDNCVDVTVAPAAQPGLPAAVSLAPASSLVGFANRCKTVKDRGAHAISVSRQRGTNTVAVRGGVFASAKPFTTSVSIESPAAVFADVLARTLAGEGIAVDGRARVVSDPDETDGRAAVPVAVRVRILSEILPVVNKRSQNLYAEVLFKLAGAAATGEPGSFAGGSAAVGAMLVRHGAAQETFTVRDGSGLSAKNRIAVRDVARVLRAMATSPHADEFLASLAIAGVEGTLDERFGGKKGYGDVGPRIVAKTGTLEGVSALSGYIRPGAGAYESAHKPGSGRTIAFSIIMNDLRNGSAAARAAQEEATLAVLRALDGKEASESATTPTR